MTKHNRYDIVIIGGGPAGATLARLLNFEKFKVLLVDGSKDEAKVCGGLLSGAA